MAYARRGKKHAGEEELSARRACPRHVACNMVGSAPVGDGHDGQTNQSAKEHFRQAFEVVEVVLSCFFTPSPNCACLSTFVVSRACAPQLCRPRIGNTVWAPSFPQPAIVAKISEFKERCGHLACPVVLSTVRRGCCGIRLLPCYS